METEKTIRPEGLPTSDQWLRLIAAGLPAKTWTLAGLWNYLHKHYKTVYEFDSTLSAEELVEALVSAIELEAVAGRGPKAQA